MRFSPFFPHGDIPVPFTPEATGSSVEGIWQGLKVFENADIDLNTIANTTMKGIKRTVRKYGGVLGHRKGTLGVCLLGYGEARREIYLPSYRWVLENKLRNEMEELYSLTNKHHVVLLDYEVNEDVNDFSRPLSHASILKKMLL